MTSSPSGTAIPLGTLDQRHLYKRSLTVAVISQVFAGAGLSAALFTLRSALAAFIVSALGGVGIVLAAVLPCGRTRGRHHGQIAMVAGPRYLRV